MTADGPAQIQPLNPYVRQEAETIAWTEGVETVVCSEGGINIGFINDGDYIKVKGVAFGDGATSFHARVASATNGGAIELRLDAGDGTVIGTYIVPSTGGWQTWITVDCPVTGAIDTHNLFFRFVGNGTNYLFNFDWWEFDNSSEK
ncbi:putative xylosidase arabinosidase protein [Phaeoacremonium minimum UCRPA7]|uniref:Putative xylosidase arabinosidase protein n=1 Tax=Phaeoacremonium minimum (strain UCR-PA7) TaxID=1286976 RepID=R8BHU9_PHAM7|nr:putative xylosidase arabinosidase protein [Phaeoacremonium minimum UCRPA7]EON98844.1 putative xylosidase arabinosidase protein [Phaeoacremonium minimum UCRPA7]